MKEPHGKAVAACPCRCQAGIHHFTRQTGERRPDPDTRQAPRRIWGQAGKSRKPWRVRGTVHSGMFSAAAKSAATSIANPSNSLEAAICPRMYSPSTE